MCHVGDVYELDTGHVGRPPPNHVGTLGPAPGVTGGGDDGAPGQEPRPQPEGAVVHDGVMGEAEHGQIHPKGGGAGGRGPGVVTGVECVSRVTKLSLGPGHVVTGHYEDDLLGLGVVSPPHEVHRVSEEASLVPPEDVLGEAALSPHPQLVSSSRVNAHNHRLFVRFIRHEVDNPPGNLHDFIFEHKFLSRLRQYFWKARKKFTKVLSILQGKPKTARCMFLQISNIIVRQENILWVKKYKVLDLIQF